MINVVQLKKEILAYLQERMAQNKGYEVCFEP